MVNIKQEIRMPIIDILMIDIYGETEHETRHWENPCLKGYVQVFGNEENNEDVYMGPFMRIKIGDVYCVLLLEDDAYEEYNECCLGNKSNHPDYTGTIMEDILLHLKVLLLEDVWVPGDLFMDRYNSYQFHFTEMGEAVYTALNNFDSLGYTSSPDIGLPIYIGSPI